MPTLYGTVRPQLSNISFAAAAGGATTAGGSLWFSAQARTRQGLNLHTTPAQVTWTAGQKIVVTIGTGAIAPGELGSVHEIWISAAASNDATAMRRLATWAALEADQQTPASLPATVDLTRDAHLVLGGSVANLAALPTGSDRVRGMVREAGGEYYTWDGSAWVEYYPWTGAADSFTSYFGASTSLAGGCDRPIQSVPAEDLIALPPYTPDGSASPRVRLCYLNLEALEIEANSPIGMVAELDGVEASDKLNGRLWARYLGKFVRNSGSLSGSAGSDTPVGLYVTTTGQNASTLRFPETLQEGEGALWEFFVKLNASDQSGLEDGGQITIYPYPQGDAGDFEPLNQLSGDLVFSAGNRLRVVPTLASVQSLDGAGILGGYVFERSSSRSAGALAADTAAQQVAIAGATRGGITVRQPGEQLLISEVLRALVSTSPGVCSPSAWSSSVAVSSSGAISLLVNYPSAVRADYPDAIAGAAATFNAPTLRCYLRFNGSTITRAADIPVANAGGTQTVLITDAGSAASLPSNADERFGLFSYGALTPAATSGGSLAAGNYEVAITYDYPSPNTRASALDHRPLSGCVNELPVTLAEFLAGRAVETLDELRAIPSAQFRPGDLWVVWGTGRAYYWDPLETGADNDGDIIEPDDSTGAGRLRLVGASGGGGVSAVEVWRISA